MDKVNNHHYRWRKRDALEIHTEYTGQAFPPPPDPNVTPYQYFKEIFDDAILSIIADNTNICAVKLIGTSLAVTTDDIKKFFGILITMLIIKLPRQHMYWSSKQFADRFSNASNSSLERCCGIFAL